MYMGAYMYVCTYIGKSKFARIADRNFRLMPVYCLCCCCCCCCFRPMQLCQRSLVVYLRICRLLLPFCWPRLVKWQGIMAIVWHVCRGSGLYEVLDRNRSLGCRFRATLLANRPGQCCVYLTGAAWLAH